MIENPRLDAGRLARTVYFRGQVERAMPSPSPNPLVSIILRMCDLTSSVPKVDVSIARAYRYIYLRAPSATEPTLVDEWDMPAPRVTPVAVVYCTTTRLLRWADARVVREAEVNRARAELHEHVKRMDAYMKECLRLADPQSHTERV